ncbi:hypothetical protein HFP51_09730 [Parasphingopyxis sp. CP4]|uniref:hypothetical protein n=1 Tax=Parasphingopyxis sp. CP4 TaxID=2724527 RepID=UPI0015A15CDE|nr:hypothetical protein [Parasphingopyxis sp. CP4]QLC22434.1 hypothetical protein HFP51_09730 [Parasphingopyxis sp. CP4]
MRTTLLIATAIAMTAAAPAAAQSVTGTVNITGSVGEKCLVTDPGPAGNTFTTTIDLGELAQADGTLRTGIEADFNAGGTGASDVDFRVVCTTANPAVTVDADPIVSANSAPAGYANTIDYQADITFSLVANGSQTVSNDTTAGTPAAASLSDRLATGGTNVNVAGSNFRTPNATDVLVADPNYTGLITITIAPTT